MKGGLLTAWTAAVVLVSYRGIKSGNTGPIAHLPMPRTIASTMVVYGALGLFPESAAPFTTMVGWGLVVAIALNLWSPPGVGPTAAQQAAISKQTPGPVNPATGYPSNIPIITTRSAN